MERAAGRKKARPSRLLQLAREAAFLLMTLAKEDAKAPADRLLLLVPVLEREAYATTVRRLTKDAAIAKQNPMVARDCRESIGAVFAVRV
jgi:hypothetical protein